MKRKSFGNMQCPVARGLEHVGEWWSLLIVRDALHGFTRFDEFQKSLDISPAILTRRLNALVEGGLMERRRYSEKPPRDEYLLTARGRDLQPVLQTLQVWGNSHFAPEGPSVQIVNRETGERAQPVLVDKITGRPLSDPVFASVAGPAADARTRAKFAGARA